jgi:tetratricopeptide (TPR) repeat protein
LKHRKCLLAVVCLIAAMVAVPTRLRAESVGPDSTMVAARELLAALQWDKAYQAFIAIANEEAAKSPNSDRWMQATFGAAVANSHGQPVSKDRVDRSMQLYEALVVARPDSKYAPRSIMNMGRLLELRDYPNDEPQYEAAREKYQQVVARWPNDPIASEATLRVAGTYVQAYDAPDFEQVRKGVDVLENWLAEHPKDPYASVMWQYLGDTYFIPLKEEAKALEAYNQVDALGWTDKGNEGPLLWRAAILAERTNNKDRAIYYYTKVITDTPNSGKAYEAQLALKRLGAPVPEISLFRKAATTRPAGGDK